MHSRGPRLEHWPERGQCWLLYLWYMLPLQGNDTILQVAQVMSRHTILQVAQVTSRHTILQVAQVMSRHCHILSVTIILSLDAILPIYT